MIVAIYDVWKSTKVKSLNTLINQCPESANPAICLWMVDIQLNLLAKLFAHLVYISVLYTN